MTPRSIIPQTALGLVLAALAGAAGAVSFPTYTIYNLGTLGGTQSSGNAISPAGSVLGNSNPAGDATTLATLWVDGAQTSLGTLGGPDSVIEWPQRNNTVFSGFSETGQADPLMEPWSCSAFFPSVTYQVCSAFRYANGQMTALPTLGGINGYGAGLNARGEIVGWAETPLHDRTCNPPQVLQFQAVRWGADGTAHVLAPLPGDPDSAATAINDMGVAAGISGRCDNAVGAYTARHVVVWLHDTPVKIATFGGKGWNTAQDINNHDEVTGFADFPGDVVNGQLQFNPVAFYSKAGRAARQIAPLAGDSNSIGYAINRFRGHRRSVVRRVRGQPRLRLARRRRGRPQHPRRGRRSAALPDLCRGHRQRRGDHRASLRGERRRLHRRTRRLSCRPERRRPRAAARQVSVPASIYQQGWRRWGFRPGVTPVAAHRS